MCVCARSRQRNCERSRMHDAWRRDARLADSHRADRPPATIESTRLHPSRRRCVGLAVRALEREYPCEMRARRPTADEPHTHTHARAEPKAPAGASGAARNARVYASDSRIARSPAHTHFHIRAARRSRSVDLQPCSADVLSASRPTHIHLTRETPGSHRASERERFQRLYILCV